MGYITDMVGHIAIVCGWPMLLFMGLRFGWQMMVAGHRVRLEREETAHRRYIEMAGLEAERELVHAREGLYPVPRHILMTQQIPRNHVALSLASMDSKRTHPGTVNNHLLEAEVKSDEAITIPALDFPQLMKAGHITGDPNRILLGHNQAGETVYRGWDELYSCVIGGLSGSGKSTTLRNILAQAVMGGCEFALVDPHAGNEESLTTSLAPMSRSMLFASGNDDASVLDTVDYFRNEFNRRKTTGEKGAPQMLIVDEATAMLRRSAVSGELSECLIEIAQEGRKFGLFAMVACQTLTVATMGKDTSLRDSFSSAFVHRSKLNHARALLQGVEEASQCARMPKGQCVFYQANGEVDIIQVPNITYDHVNDLFGGRTTEVVLDPLETRVREALIHQHSMGQIVREVFGVEGKGGRYRQAIEDIRRINAKLLSG